MKGLWQQMIEHSEKNPPEPYNLENLKKAAKKLFDNLQEYSGSTICHRMIWKSDKKEFMVTCSLKDCEICNNWKESLIKMNKYYDNNR